ncbi:MAG: pseudouridine synthase [Bacteroidota bacterium]
MFDYFIIYKPYGYLSQFTKETEDHLTLADLDFPFPSDAYPVGRLDKDSEGLLIITNDKKLNAKLLHPKNKHRRTYLVQVDNIPTKEAIDQLSQGVDIKINKKIHHTLPATATLLSNPPTLPDRDPPVRFRKNIPTAWVSLTLTEGKNRQVRRMCAKVGYPVLRLVRLRIENLVLDPLLVGSVKRVEKTEIYRLLRI